MGGNQRPFYWDESCLRKLPREGVKDAPHPRRRPPAVFRQRQPELGVKHVYPSSTRSSDQSSDSRPFSAEISVLMLLIGDIQDGTRPFLIQPRRLSECNGVINCNFRSATVYGFLKCNKPLAIFITWWFVPKGVQHILQVLVTHSLSWHPGWGLQGQVTFEGMSYVPSSSVGTAQGTMDGTWFPSPEGPSSSFDKSLEC